MSKEPRELEIAEERALIQRAKSGDSQAMDELLQAHQDMVFRTAVGYLGGDEESAYEVAQEVLIAAFRKLDSFRGESRLSTWLYRMTMNYAKNHQSSRSRREARFVPMEVRRTGDSSGEVLRPQFVDTRNARDQVDDQDAASSVADQLEKLPEEFRSVLILRFVEQLSYDEIGAALDLPPGTVKSRINRGRTLLRTAMKSTLEERGLGR